MTADVNTLIGFAYEQIQRGTPTTGVLVLKRGTSIGEAIRELELLHAVGEQEEFMNGIWYIPL